MRFPSLFFLWKDPEVSRRGNKLSFSVFGMYCRPPFFSVRAPFFVLTPLRNRFPFFFLQPVSPSPPPLTRHVFSPRFRRDPFFFTLPPSGYRKNIVFSLSTKTPTGSLVIGHLELVQKLLLPPLFSPPAGCDWGFPLSLGSEENPLLKGGGEAFFFSPPWKDMEKLPPGLIRLRSEGGALPSFY